MERGEIQKEIVDRIPPKPHGLIQLAPRVGKTKIAIDILKREKPKKVLWVTLNTKLRDKDIPEEFLKWRAKGLLTNTDILCYPSLKKVKGHYDIIILDEYQDLTPQNAKTLLSGELTYGSILGLSGTHPKHQEKNDLYDSLKLDALVSMSIDDAVELGLIAPYNIKVVLLPLDDKVKYIKSGKTGKTFYQTERQKYTYFNKVLGKYEQEFQYPPASFYMNRMKFIYQLESKHQYTKQILKKMQGRTLVFTSSIQRAEELSKHTHHSKKAKNDDTMKKFIEGEIPTLACVNAGGIGFTYRGVDNFIITQVNSDTKGDATQKIARSLVKQDNYVANIYLIVSADTVDEQWKDKVLQNFNPSRVEYINFKDLL